MLYDPGNILQERIDNTKCNIYQYGKFFSFMDTVTHKMSCVQLTLCGRRRLERGAVPVMEMICALLSRGSLSMIDELQGHCFVCCAQVVSCRATLAVTVCEVILAQI